MGLQPYQGALRHFAAISREVLIKGVGLDAAVPRASFGKAVRAGPTQASVQSRNEAQAPTAEMAVTPPSIRKSAPTTYAESSDAR